MTADAVARTVADRRHASGSATDPCAVPRLLWADPAVDSPSLFAHLRRHGTLPSGKSAGDQERLMAEVVAAGILGRGGAGFPMARKLAAIRGPGRRPVVVGNGTEGEPASDKDKVLLTQAPHLVLDGASLAARIVGADRAFLVVPDVVLPAVRAAMAERRTARLDQVEIRLVPSARGFVAGEASAVVSWLEHGVPLPHLTPPRLTERGLKGRPTLVHNVETLAQLALVARHGAAWFRSVGEPEEPGTMLVTVCGAVDRPGVREVPMGIPIRDLVGSGTMSRAVGPILIGGYSGVWLSEEEWPRLSLSRSSLRPLGASPGAGLVAALPRERCGLIESSRVVRYLARESAGQCGPCLFGLDAIAGEFERLAHTRDGDPARLRRWVDQVDGRGACGHPDGVARLCRSVLHVFADEIKRHGEGWCQGTSENPVLPIPPEGTDR